MNLREEKIIIKKQKTTVGDERTFDFGFMYGFHTDIREKALRDHAKKKIKLLNGELKTVEDLIKSTFKCTNKEYYHLEKEFDSILFDDWNKASFYIKL